MNIMGLEVPICLVCRKNGDMTERLDVEARIVAEPVEMIHIGFTDLPDTDKIGTTDVELDEFDDDVEMEDDSSDNVHKEGGLFEVEDYNAKWADWESVDGTGNARAAERDIAMTERDP
jgi:hypothetical protein